MSYQRMVYSGLVMMIVGSLPIKGGIRVNTNICIPSCPGKAVGLGCYYEHFTIISR